jgi:D-alanine-D-alanine ligase
MKMKIAVFWRKNRNVEFQKKLTEENIFDDAYEEARSHKEGLVEAGFDTILVEWTGEPMEMSKKIEEEKISFVFNASSDDELRFLEAFKIPYTGTRLQISGLDKAYRKIIVAHFGVTTPEFTLAYSKDTLPEIKMDYPLFVKPLNGRGSAGISEENIIRSLEELPSVVGKITEKMNQPALIEGFIEGRELTVGIIGYKTPIVLPLLEIGYTFGNTNTYEHKMLDQEIIKCPMKIPKEVEEKIIKMALKIYKTLDIADYGRVDMILDKNNTPYFLEVNTFPGLNMPSDKDAKTAHIGYMGYMAKNKGYSRAEFLKFIVNSTIERYQLS